MEDKNLLDKIITLTEDIVKLKMENVRLKEELKREQELNRFRTELAESEDEKVKRIIHSISNKISFHLHNIFTEEEFQCFDAWSNAWLKKQDKPKWTDEDEERLQSCIIELQGKGLMGGVDTIDTKWLKSLKQRLEEQQ